MKRLGLVLLALTLVSGCFGTSRPDFDAIHADVNTAAQPFLVHDHGVSDTDLGHRDVDLHQGGMNLDLLAYHNGVDESGDPNRIPAQGIYTEFAVTADHAYLARASADGSSGGFVILALNKDADGVPHPSFVGEFDAQPGADLEVSASQDLAFFATQRSSINDIVTGAATSQTPASAQPRGIHVVDISDKANPTQVAFVPLPNNGPHTLTYVQLADTEYLLAATYDLPGSSLGYVDGVPPLPLPIGVVPGTQRVTVFQLARGPDAGQAALVPVGTYQDNAQPQDDAKRFFPHDTFVEERDGQVLMYVAYWDNGVHVVDFSNPAALAAPGALLAQWTDFGPSSLTPQMHFARPFTDRIANRVVTVAEPEVPESDAETGQITFLDTTDLAAVKKLGHWSLPAKPGVVAFDYSPHNFDTFDGKVVLAHNHAGVWVIDVSDEENLANPKSVAFALPTKARQDSPTEQPRVWGALEDAGIVYAIDEPTGLYAYRYTGP